MRRSYVGRAVPGRQARLQVALAVDGDVLGAPVGFGKQAGEDVGVAQGQRQLFHEGQPAVVDGNGG